MPLPLGHAAIGLATFELNAGTSAFRRWKRFVLIVLLANLPDIDVLIGLIFRWDGNAFHRGPTHSLMFALLGGFLAFYAGRHWLKIAEISYRQSVLLIFSHVIADAVFTDAAVSLFWPFELNWSSGHSGWTDVVHSLLFDGYKDGWIVLGCAVGIVLFRFIRRPLEPTRSLPQIVNK